MTFEIVTTTAHPMVHVTCSAGMDPAEIGAAMGRAFGDVGAWLAKHGVDPAGPPLAVYRDWDGSTMQIDVGYPVLQPDAAPQDGGVGPVQAGLTPAGPALERDEISLKHIRH